MKAKLLFLLPSLLLTPSCAKEVENIIWRSDALDISIALHGSGDETTPYDIVYTKDEYPDLKYMIISETSLKVRTDDHTQFDYYNISYTLHYYVN